MINADMEPSQDVFPCQYYNIDPDDDDNPLRDIMGNLADQRRYFENMSRSFAQHCGETVYLMTDAATNADVDQTGIWGRVEQIELQATGSGTNKVSMTMLELKEVG